MSDGVAVSVIGVVAESAPGETRVAATPDTVGRLVALGYRVQVESGAGEKSSFSDDAYAAAGASIGGRADTWRSQIVLKVNAPTTDEIAQLAEGATLVGLINPGLDPDLVEALAARPIT
ncbi:MAG: NAD(P)(+) transhydrogenase (Re/Si-specific) subunit alpha, partial [Chloroflexota bacterium]|nr:NAD(P)(+) transhydrogenase (Re/Si-specific) subunit alpha [Chloroflexota bacterium]